MKNNHSHSKISMMEAEETLNNVKEEKNMEISMMEDEEEIINVYEERNTGDNSMRPKIGKQRNSIEESSQETGFFKLGHKSNKLKDTLTCCLGNFNTAKKCVKTNLKRAKNLSFNVSRNVGFFANQNETKISKDVAKYPYAQSLSQNLNNKESKLNKGKKLKTPIGKISLGERHLKSNQENIPNKTFVPKAFCKKYEPKKKLNKFALSLLHSYPYITPNKSANELQTIFSRSGVKTECANEYQAKHAKYNSKTISFVSDMLEIFV